MISSNYTKQGLIASAAIFSALWLTGCGTGEAQTKAQEMNAAATPLPVEVALPQKADVYATYHATTALESDADAPVLARVAGEVIDILVEEGDRVVAGQVLARLDGERLRLEMEQAKANLEMSVREYERMISLHERGLISTAAFEGMEYDVEALQANYELTRLNYDYTKLRAPISGVVSERMIKLGQHVDVSDAGFRITDNSTLVARLKIPQSEMGKISAGDEVELRVDAMPGETFVAKISRVSPTIDAQNGTFRATAYVNNASEMLAPGMFGRFDIAYEKHDDVLTIPQVAVVEEDNETVVYVVDEGAAVRRVIETGIENNGMIEVLEGLAATDRIVVTGQGSLRDGSRVLASIPTGVPFAG